MSQDTDKFLSPEMAAQRLMAQGKEFVAIRNPGYVFPPEEYCPLADRIEEPVDRLVAVVQDMDGSTTTTETLCLHSLETMVRRITARPTTDEWNGLDHVKDYPHVIGNSTTRHVEYLIKTYGDCIRDEALVRAMLEAAAWTFTEGADPKRREEVKTTLDALDWTIHLASDSEWQTVSTKKPFDFHAAAPVLDRVAKRHATDLKVDGFNEQVRTAIDIYYYRYHEILKAIARGEGQRLAGELTEGRPLIEPMSGVAIFQTLIKGWLGEQAGELYDLLRESLRVDLKLPPRDEGRKRLAALGRHFAEHPLKVAVVTSSIRYEAEIVLGEVLNVVRKQIRGWPVCAELADRLNGLDDLFDTIVTASDSSEIRLKPHRDLYSMALHALGIMPEDFGAVVGFEDSESGTISIRAAGIGLCVAIPFADTAGHDLSAASHILKGGLPQAILEKGLFLKA